MSQSFALFYLVVGRFLATKKTKNEEAKEYVVEHEDIGADKVDVFADEYDEGYENHAHVKHANDIVKHLKKICSNIKNQQNVKSDFKLLQSDLGFPFNVKLDVRTRWNSTYHMMCRVVSLMEPFGSFLTYYNSAAGRKEFAASKMKLNMIDESLWAIIEGLMELL